jgi:hypothetical protein
MDRNCSQNLNGQSAYEQLNIYEYQHYAVQKPFSQLHVLAKKKKNNAWTNKLVDM